MKRKKIKKQKNLVVISFYYTPIIIFFCADKPIYIARNEKVISGILNKIDPGQKRNIYILDYPFAAYLFETNWWRELKFELKSEERAMEEIEHFLLNCEQGLWN